MHIKLLFSLSITLFAGCSSDQNSGTDSQNLKTDTIGISGMVCDGCAHTIGRKLKDREGVANQRVTYKDSLAIVTYDREKIDKENIEKVINDAGYQIRKTQ